MIRDRVLTISTLAALMALSSVAQAGPKVTDKTYSPNEVGRSSQSRQTDRYRARAMQGAAPPALGDELQAHLGAREVDKVPGGLPVAEGTACTPMTTVEARLRERRSARRRPWP